MSIDPGSGLNLAFRLLRLTPPSLHANLPSLSYNVARVVGFSAMLQLPTGTDVLLGETLSCYVRLINLADAALTNIIVKCELQTDRQRLMLHDTATNPLSRLAAGDSYDFLLRHDVKDPNDHILTFSATYIAADGSARTEQQTVVFVASNPLSVRTKTRVVAGSVFVEVCVENQSATVPLFLEYVRLEAPAGLGPVQNLSAAAAPSAASAASGDPAEYLQQHLESLTIVQPNGAHNLLYSLKTPSLAASAGRADGKVDIGRLEIKWRRSMGEAGRLQTQHILLSAAQPGVEMRLEEVPAAVQLERPFPAAISLRNNLDRRLGPLRIDYSALASGTAAPPFLVQGLQEAALEELPPHGAATLALTLVPLAPGVHSLSGLSLVEGGSKAVASLEADILVQVEDPE